MQFIPTPIFACQSKSHATLTNQSKQEKFTKMELLTFFDEKNFYFVALLKYVSCMTITRQAYCLQHFAQKIDEIYEEIWPEF